MPMYGISRVEDLLQPRSRLASIPSPGWQLEWILREGGVSRFNSYTGVVLLQFPWYFADTFYNLLWVAEHATTQLWVTWKKYFLLLVNFFLSALLWSFNVKTCSLLYGLHDTSGSCRLFSFLLQYRGTIFCGAHSLIFRDDPLTALTVLLWSLNSGKCFVDALKGVRTDL